MRRSIRWTLLGWYAAILVLVIGGFGIGLFLHQRWAALAEVDAELRTHAMAIANAVEWDEDDGFEIELGEEYRSYLRQEGPDAHYLGIWGPAGDLLLGTPSLPASLTGPPHAPSGEASRREVLKSGTNDTTILVGRHVAVLLGESRRLGWSILVGALATLLVSLLAGWLLVGRVLKPIDRITRVASRISASNLAERVDIGRTESELERLAGTLNGAFDRLEEAVERQARFTADASHELRTPLAVIQASADWALRRERRTEDYVEALEGTRRAAERMRRLVDDLLRLARIDAGKPELQLEVVDLAASAAEASALLAPLARSRGVDVVLRGDAGPVHGDRGQLLGLATILLENALEHASEDGRVEIRTGLDDQAAWLEVQDDGEGIDEKHLPRIFDRFYRADPARSSTSGGTGLGLAIAKEVVKVHGGDIRASSRVGEGMTFRVRLPPSAPA